MTPTENLVQDVTGAIVVSFGLDLPSGILSLMFDEPVWLILPREIIIPDAVNSTATYTLTTSHAQYPASTNINITKFPTLPIRRRFGRKFCYFMCGWYKCYQSNICH